MEQNANNTKLNEMNGWETRKASLYSFIEELGNSTAEHVVNNGCQKSGTAQALAVLLHCSAGYVGDKFRPCKTTDEKVEVLAGLIAPALTPEELKAQNLATAKNTIATLTEKGLDEATIRLCVSAMPQGKQALAEIFG